MKTISFEYVQSLCDAIDAQTKIIEKLNDSNRELHQILAMHNICFIEEDEENENDGNVI